MAGPCAFHGELGRLMLRIYQIGKNTVSQLPLTYNRYPVIGMMMFSHSTSVRQFL